MSPALARRWVINALLALSIGLILSITLFPRSGEGSMHLIPLTRSWQLILEADVKALRLVGGNVLLFVPFGFFAGLRRQRTGGLLCVVGFGALLSMAIEITQYSAVPGRSFEIDDVLLNSLGALAGSLAARWLLCQRSRPIPDRRH